MKKTLVSVIVPIYNAKEYLQDCVESLLNQTYKNIEILLVDDGSNDGTEVLCEELAKSDERICVFHKENGGTHTVRNLGVENANGDYLMFIDPDDWLDLDTIERCMVYANNEDLDVIRFNYVREFEGQSLKKENKLLEERLYIGDECKNLARLTTGLIQNELNNPETFNFLASACFNIYRKSVIIDNNIKFPNIREIGTFSDGLFNILVFLNINKFRFMDVGFYHYRKTNTGSATYNYRQDFLNKQLLMFDIIKKSIPMEEDDFKKAYYNRIAFTTFELCLNVFKRKSTYKQKYNEIKSIICDELHVEAFKHFELSNLPIKWKVYNLFIKMRCTRCVVLLTKVMRYIQKSR